VLDLKTLLTCSALVGPVALAACDDGEGPATAGITPIAALEVKPCESETRDGDTGQWWVKRTYTYDAAGRLSGGEVYFDPEALSYTVAIEYDSYGRMIRETLDYPEEDIASWVTTYSYGTDGRLAKIAGGEPGEDGYYESVYSYGADGPDSWSTHDGDALFTGKATTSGVSMSYGDTDTVLTTTRSFDMTTYLASHWVENLHRFGITEWTDSDIGVRTYTWQDGKIVTDRKVQHDGLSQVTTWKYSCQ